ncbi:hypothetical protein Cst04h_24480 [Corynebacterium striatum]|uniref:Uncharacterized protein n=1 Tax=Corynebacterium striatum TaxID=43770 RepID=A0ABC9ZQ89_CORST|nr:hypothetical protein Cst04h_24480 [Corynebacterium striatum]GKH16580.1 hypothetical protein CE91St29_08930 [Corynebacterium striatum]
MRDGLYLLRVKPLRQRIWASWSLIGCRVTSEPLAGRGWWSGGAGRLPKAAEEIRLLASTESTG